jgi:threonine/homoserine/homoserine lactone efflux protein
MISFAHGLAFGLILQLSVGPVCLAVIAEALARGARSALRLVLGVVLVDAAYLALGATGVAAVLRVAAVRAALGVVGALVIAAFGVLALRTPGGRPQSPAAAPSSSSFGRGIVLTGSSPLTILFWTGAFGSLVASGRIVGGLALTLFALGCLAATPLFLIPLAWAAHGLASRIQGGPIRWLNRVVGLALVGFAVKLLVESLR